jgi:nucleotide-binding universal stress UspA family protein
MSRDPYLDMRRHLAAEAYHWKEGQRREEQAQLESVAEPPQAATVPPIVVGYDGTAGALPALSWALTEAQGRQAPLVIVRAWRWDEELAEPGLLVESEQLEELARSTLPDWVREAEDLRVVVAPGAAGSSIVEQGGTAELIVVGRRRLGALQRAWLGSTSKYVVEHAPCPVVVVPETTWPAAPAASWTASEHETTNIGTPV